MKRRNNSGQGLMEYMLLIMLVSIACMGVVSVVGQNLRAKFATVSDVLHGREGNRNLEQVDPSLIQLRGIEDAHKAAFPKKR